jgi:hypothetical protein
VQVMETMKRALDAEHPTTLSNMAILAHTWKSPNRDPEALKLMEVCVELLNMVFGSIHLAKCLFHCSINKVAYVRLRRTLMPSNTKVLALVV